MVRVLFYENVPVYCSETNIQIATKSYTLLNLKIEERQNRSEKEYVFCLTREDDPLFVYTLALRRADYELLKREQELDAEFDAFPKKIIDFVTCLETNCGSHLRGSISDDNIIFRFDLVGKMGFKWVTVLSLSLRKVTETALIAHLAEKIVKYKVCLKELDVLRDSLSAEQAENKSLKNSLTAAEKLRMECLKKWEEERIELSESKQKLEELNEELIADKQMLSQEVSTLKEEVVDFRDRIDDLNEQVNQLEERVRILTEELNTSESHLRDVEHRKVVLEQELADRNEETHSRMMQIRELKETVNEFGDENKKLHEKLQLLKEDRDRWKSEHDKAVVIIKKLYNEKPRYDDVVAEKVIELERDLEERKRAIDALTDSNSELRAKLENLSLEYEKARKDAAAWEARCEKKELLINDLIQCRRSTPIINPLQQQPLNYGNVTPTVYPRVLGVANWTAQITTPLRNTGTGTKTLDRHNENELNSVAVTPPTEPQLVKGVTPPKEIQWMNKVTPPTEPQLIKGVARSKT